MKIEAFRNVRVGPLFDCSLNPSLSCLEYFRRIFSRHFVPIGGQPMAAMRLRIWKLKKLLNVMGRQISPLPHDRGVGPGGLGRRAAGRERNRSQSGAPRAPPFPVSCANSQSTEL